MYKRQVAIFPPNLGGLSPPIVTLSSGFSRPPARPPPLWLPQLAGRTPPAPCARPPPAAVESPIAFSWCPTPTTAAQCFRPPKASRSRWGSKQNLPNSKLNCTDSRPWARWYRLRGLPLAGSECVCPQCNSYFVITREVPNNRRSAFPSISQELTRNANRESGTPVTGNSPTVKCPMVRSQRLSLIHI